MAEKLNLRIDAGAGYSFSVLCEDSAGDPIDLSGATAVAEIREKYDDTSSLAAFTVDDTGAATGTFVLSLTHIDTSALQGTTKAFWDLFITLSGAEPAKILYGTVLITQAASRTA